MTAVLCITGQAGATGSESAGREREERTVHSGQYWLCVFMYIMCMSVMYYVLQSLKTVFWHAFFLSLEVQVHAHHVYMNTYAVCGYCN